MPRLSVLPAGMTSAGLLLPDWGCHVLFRRRAAPLTGERYRPPAEGTGLRIQSGRKRMAINEWQQWSGFPFDDRRPYERFGYGSPYERSQYSFGREPYSFAGESYS